MKNDVSENTMKMYLSTLNALAKSVGHKLDDDSDDGLWIEKNYEKLLQHVYSSASKHTQKNKIAVLLVFAQTFGLKDKTIKDLAERMDKLGQEVKANYESNQMNEKQKENWLTVEELDAKIAELKADIPKGSLSGFADYNRVIKYLVLLIYKFVPLRNDIVEVKLQPGAPPKTLPDDDINYIYLPKASTASLVLNSYKTKESFKQKVIKLPQEITAELRRFMPLIESVSPNKWFLVGKRNQDEHMTRNAFTKFLNKVFGKKVSTSMIRHTIVSSLYKVDKDEYKKKQELAHNMGHSVDTAALVYAKDLSALPDKS
jgi:predicted transcriptional regulator